MSKFVTFPKGPNHAGDDDGGGFDERLRRVEQAVVLLEERSRHQATKAWVLAGVLGGMGIASALALGIAKLVWNG